MTRNLEFEEIFARKEAQRKELAKLPFEEKLKIVMRLRELGNAKRTGKIKFKKPLPTRRRKSLGPSATMVPSLLALRISRLGIEQQKLSSPESGLTVVVAPTLTSQLSVATDRWMNHLKAPTSSLWLSIRPNYESDS